MNSFKVWLLNNDIVEKIVIFNGENVEDFGIFSDEELEWVDSDNTVISRAMLHSDDSICDVKHKIARELQCNYEDIYMFCYKKRKINLSQLMASFTTRESLQQFMKNIDLDGININKTFAFGSDEERVLSLKTSLGMHVDDWLFSPNPFHTTEASSAQRVSYDDGVLLGDDIECNNIYVCLAKDVQESLRELYFPNKAALSPSEDMETIDEMYQIYYNRPREIVSNNGIQSFTLEIKTHNPRSLNIVFRNLHCDADFPFVQYNRGFHTESIYRLFSLSITKNGKRIPLLNKDKITELAKITSGGEIAIYNMVHNLVIVVDREGVVKVSGTFTELKQVSELETMLKTVLNPLFAKYCNYQFDSFDGHRVRVNYQYSTVQAKPVTLNDRYVEAIFGKESRYKRVAHYSPMDKFNTMLYDTYDKYGMNEFLTRHKMNREDAVQFTREFESKNPGARVMVMNIGNNFLARVFELDSVDYVRHLNIYLDSLVLGVSVDKTLIKRRYVETMMPTINDYEIDYSDNEDGIGFSDDDNEKEKADEEEERHTRNVWLENNFFRVYRSLALDMMESIENRERVSKAGSVSRLVKVIQEITEPVAIFSKISKSVLESLSNDEINMSALVENERQMLFPKRNLLTREMNCDVYATRMAEEIITMENSIESQSLDVHENEIIVLESLLKSRDYFLDMVASENNECLRIVPSDKSWRFFAGTNRLEFLATPECSFGPIVYILHQVKNKLYKLSTIKKMLWKAYNVFFDNDKDQIALAINLSKQGVDVEELMMSEAYYMTATDMEVFAKVYDLPVMMFSTADRSMKKLGGEGSREFFFYESLPGFQGWPNNVLIDRLLSA